MNVKLGISSFGETTPLEKTGKTISHDQRIRDLFGRNSFSRPSWN